MQQRQWGVAWAIMALLVVPAGVRAEATPNRGCRSARFDTCASVSIRMLGHRVLLDVANRTGTSTDARPVELDPWVARGLVPFNGPGAIERDRPRLDEHRDGCLTEAGELRDGPDCVGSSVVTPEPVTLTLLATGLAGMAGVGAARRRRGSTGPV